MLIGTFVFLLLKAPISLLILSFSTCTTYGVFQFKKLTINQATLFVLVQNVGLFVAYKTGVGHQLLSPIDRLIPLGLSYYSFRQIHYAIEQYKGKLSQHHFMDYAGYMFFLPTMLIGPINRFQPYLRNTYRRRWDSNLFSEGLERIVYGYAKIVIIGNFLITYGLTALLNSLEIQSGWLYSYLSLLKYTLNTYFQFAGYSDVAIGLALLFGYRVMENFNYPFFADNINEFWNRWHISLSSWCRDYVYTPVASMSRKPIMGILLTMVVIGLWHEISWKYLIWALYHGVGIAIWHLYNRAQFANKLRRKDTYNYVSILFTFHFVMFSFVIIQQNTWQAMLTTYKVLTGF